MAMALSFVFWSLLLISTLDRFCAAQAYMSTLANNFTLAAWNTTLPNSNSTGAPLVLGEDGETSGITFHVTSTYASFPYNDYPYLGLVNGSLRAYAADGWWRTNATAVQSGGTLGWVTSTVYSTTAPRVYSAVKSTLATEPYSLLAADGFYNLWSLCPFPSSGQTNVVFNVSETSQSYDAKECYPVRINIVPTN